LAGITEEAARLIDGQSTLHPAVNWYFMITSTFLITAVGTCVTTREVEPRLGPYRVPDPATKTDRDTLLAGPSWLPPVMADLPGFGVLRNPDTGGLLDSAFPRGVVAWIALFYLWVFALGLPVGPGAPTYYPAA